MATGIAALVLDGLKAFYADDLAEKVVYRPGGGEPRTVIAHVLRNPPQGLDGQSHGAAPFAVMTFANDRIEGVHSDEVNLGRDTVEYAVRKGEETEARSIKRERHDAGQVVLEVR